MQAINELHEDEDFQQDAGQSHILGVVDEIRTDASAMAKYEKDAVVMHVLKKLRRFQVPFNFYLPDMLLHIVSAPRQSRLLACARMQTALPGQIGDLAYVQVCFCAELHRMFELWSQSSKLQYLLEAHALLL